MDQKRGREELIRDYFDDLRTRDAPLGSAWEEVTLWQGSPGEWWRLVLELVAAAPNPAAIGSIAAGPLENLIETHPRLVTRWIEKEAPSNPRLRDAIAGVWIGPPDIPQDLADRIFKFAQRGAAAWPIAASGLPVVAETLLASDDPIDRCWGIEQIDLDHPSPPVVERLRALLGDADDRVVGAAAERLSIFEDVHSLSEMVELIGKHSGVNGGVQLALAALSLTERAPNELADQARAVVVEMARRGDDGIRVAVDDVLNPNESLDIDLTALSQMEQVAAIDRARGKRGEDADWVQDAVARGRERLNALRVRYPPPK